MSIIKCPNDFKTSKKRWKVFLAGPIQGAPAWQDEIGEFFDIPEVEWISPRRPNDQISEATYGVGQMEWETQALDYADIILVWIPEPVEDVPGRSYAQTTRFEVAENLAKGKKMIIGTYRKFSGRNYFEYKASKYDNIIGDTICSSLDECIDLLKNYINKDTRFTIPSKECKKMYVLCNRRLAPMYASVQGGHALTQWIEDHPGKFTMDTALIYLNCRLDKKIEEMKDHGYDFSVFKEPDLNNTITAAACLGDKDLLFTRLKTLG